MMLGSGVGLCGVGSYLLYYGVTVYRTGPDPASTTPAAQASDINRNHSQGTVYLARSPERVAKRSQADGRARGCLQQLTSGTTRPWSLLNS